MKLILFKNNSVEAISLLENTVEKWLEASSEIIENQVKTNTCIKTGKTKNSWTHRVNSKEKNAVIGNPLKNAVWEEFGTGEYALGGNGRKGGWFYTDENNIGHFTYGKHPRRPLYNAFNERKYHVINLAKKFFQEDFK